MASIPLPALHVNPPQDPTEGIQRMVALKGMLQQQQLQNVNIQQQQMALKDQQTLRGLFIKHQGNLDKVIQDAPQAGVSPQTIQQLQLHNIDVKTKTADLVSKDAANAQTQADLMLGAHDAVDKAPAEQKPAIYQQQLQALQQRGVDVSQMPPQYPGDDQFKMLGAVVKGHKQQVEDATKATEAQKNAAQAAEANARAGEAQAQTKKINTELQYTSGPAAEGRYRFVLSRLAAKAPVSQEDLDFARGFEASNAKTTSTSDSLGVTSTNSSRPSGLATVSGRTAAPAGGASGGAQPSGGLKDSLVDAIGQYKYNPMLFSRVAIKHPEILAAVTQKYPDWSQSNYNAANKAITDLAPSGKTGQQITSYNTFLRHAGALYDAVNTLDNSKYSDLLNKPLNWLAQHTGDPRVADFMAAMQPPMKEFQAFLLNNHAMHDEDVKDAHSLIDVNKTPQEIRAVLKRFAETGSARLSEQNESFKRVTGRDIPNLVSPEAAKAYNKITTGGMVTMRAPNGQTKQVPADQVEHYKSLGAVPINQ